MKNNLLKKFLSFSAGGYIALIVGFFTTPIITRMLSPEQYGIASIFILTNNILMLLVILGLDQGFVRYFYEEKNESRGKLLLKCLKYPLVLIVIIGIIILIFNKKISMIIYNEENFKMIIVLIFMVFFSLINRFSILIIRMQQKAKLFSFFQVLNQILNFSLILLLFKYYGNNYRTIVLAATIATVGVTIVSMITERNIWIFKGEKAETLEKELLKYSMPFILTMALTWIFQSADKIAIKIYSDMVELGLYAAAFKIIALINIVQNGFTTFWIPVAYEKYQKEPENKIFFKNVNDYISLLMLIVAVGILICKDLIVLLLGDKYREAAAIMPTLVMMPIMYTISETTVLGINFKKKTSYHTYISIIVAAVNIIGNFLLVPKFGAKGAAISTGLAYILFFSARTYYSVKLIDFKFNLKRIYFLILLIMSYAIFLTFNNNRILGTGIGVILIFLIIFSYMEVIKFFINKFIKKGELNND